MRNILKLFAVFVLSFTVTNWAIAGFPPLRIGGLLQALKTKFTLLFPNNSVVDKGGVTAYIDTGNKSHLYDGDFEGSSVASEWSVTNATATLVDTERVNGKQHLNLAVAAAIPSISQDQNVTVGGSFVASCWIKTDQIDVQFCSRIDGSDSVCQNVSADNKWFKYSHQNFTSDTSTSFGVSIKGLSSITGDIKVDNCELEFGDQTQNIAQSEFVFDVNIGGANMGLGAAVSSYAPFGNASLDMVVNKGSGLEIPCTSPNTSTGLTCSVGTEQVGVVFDALVGTYEICASVSVYTATSVSSSYTTFQLIETPNDSQTILQEGGSRMESGSTNSASTNVSQSFTNCGTFEFATAGRKTIRLMYEKVSTGTITVLADRRTDLGQRDIHITGKYYPRQSQIVRQGTENFAKSLGTLTFPSNSGCDWTIAKTNTNFVDFPVDSNCTLPTTSTNAVIKSSGNKQPEFVLPKGSPSGLYEITVNGIFHNDFNTNNSYCSYRFSDGTDSTNILTEYVENRDSFDGSKTFEIYIDSDTESDKTFTLQAAVQTSSAGNCILRNVYTAANAPDTTISVKYTPTDQKMTITGSFEQIKSLETPYVYAEGNNGASITANTDINFTEVEDASGLWTNNTTYSPNEDGWYFITGSTGATASHAGTFYIHDGTSTLFYLAPNNLSATVKPFQGIVYLEASKNYTFRATATFTANNSSDVHRIYIQKWVDTGTLIKNLNPSNVKCQTKYLSANVSSTGVMSDLTFNNLTIGKKYNIRFHHSMIWSATGQAVSQVSISNSSPVCNSLLGGQHNAGNGNFSVGCNDDFIASATTLTHNLTASTISYLFGTGPTSTSTHATLCELTDNYIQGSF